MPAMTGTGHCSQGWGYDAMFVVFIVVFGIIVGMIAQSKGRSFLPWFIYGALIFIVAIVHVLIIKPTETHSEREALALGGKKCPRCAEIVKEQAMVCRFCGHEFPEARLG